MNYRHAKLPEMENVGLIDGAARGALSIAAIVAILLVPAMSETALIVLTLFAIYAGLTAFFAWDPFYALANRPQPQTPRPAPVSVPIAGRAGQRREDGRKKAA